MTDIPPPFDATWFRLIAGLVIGLTFGSFVTMLLIVCRDASRLSGRARHCRSCKTPLKPRDLVPVLSWVMQRGKCRYCSAFIGWRYVLIEIVLACSRRRPPSSFSASRLGF